jgi:hypothetical protein
MQCMQRHPTAQGLHTTAVRLEALDVTCKPLQHGGLVTSDFVTYMRHKSPTSLLVIQVAEL